MTGLDGQSWCCGRGACLPGRLPGQCALLPWLEEVLRGLLAGCCAHNASQCCSLMPGYLAGLLGCRPQEGVL